MSGSIWTYANPRKFMDLTDRVLPPLAVATAATLLIGVVWSASPLPAAELHGDRVRMLFVHVPSSLMAVNVYLIMVVASIIGYVRGHHVSHLVAKAAAPIGAAFTVVAIVTGAIWGQQSWGSWWEWDAQLTAVLVLLFFYIGYMALWQVIEEPTEAAELAAILCMFGSVFALASRYAVMFFTTQHQGATLSLDQEENIGDVYFYPLIVMILAHYLLFMTLLIVGVRTEIRARRLRALRLSAG